MCFPDDLNSLSFITFRKPPSKNFVYLFPLNFFFCRSMRINAFALTSTLEMSVNFLIASVIKEHPV